MVTNLATSRIAQKNHWSMVAFNSHEIFTSHEMEEGIEQLVDSIVGVWIV